MYLCKLNIEIVTSDFPVIKYGLIRLAVANYKGGFGAVDYFTGLIMAVIVYCELNLGWVGYTADLSFSVKEYFGPTQNRPFTAQSR